MLIGYLGPKGTFSEEAATRYFAGTGASLIAYPTVPEVMEDVCKGVLDQGILPLENTIEGSINLTLDSLADAQNVFVHGELILSVSLQLLGIPFAKLDDIEEVWSISPAIAQCYKFIRGLGASMQLTDSTASAAKLVKEAADVHRAAVASSWAAKEFGLQILASNIQDVALNHTRFVVFSQKDTFRSDADKTMLLITPSQEHAGMLANILQVFATLELNLAWIESRPTKARLGTYQFYMEVQVGIHDERMGKALAILDILGHQVRVLGSFVGGKLQSTEALTF